MDIESLKSFYGKVHEFVTPSGYKVAIREQNGNDDDIISKVGNGSVDGINLFIKGIIVGCELYPEMKELTLEQVMKMKLRDKYVTLIQSRIFSLGNILHFEYDWKIPGQGKLPYDEDLSEYIWDYSKPFPKEEDSLYNKYKVQPYKNGAETEKFLVLSSGKKVKYLYLNGYGEKYLLDKPEREITMNDEMKARFLHLEVNGDYIRVENFKDFNPRDMIQLRADIRECDDRTEGLTDIENPMTGASLSLPLLGIMDFFFPREI